MPDQTMLDPEALRPNNNEKAVRVGTLFYTDLKTYTSQNRRRNNNTIKTIKLSILIYGSTLKKMKRKRKQNGRI